MGKEQIRFHYQTRNFRFRHRGKVKQHLLHLFDAEGKKLESLTYVFCTDEYLLEINQEFLKHDTLTDVISFRLSALNDSLVAEIYISTDRVKENAVLHHSSFNAELLRVMIHGALHFCGYNDKTPPLKKRMSQKEDEYLGKFFVPRGTG